MDYFKAFDKVKTGFSKIDVPNTDDNFAIQVNLTDSDCSGIFYIEMKDKQLFVEPYDYYDNDAIVTTRLNDFTDILEGKLKPVDAVISGKITINGNETKLLNFFDSFKQKSAPKKAAKKAAPKKIEKKAVSKKAAAPKAAPVKAVVAPAVAAPAKTVVTPVVTAPKIFSAPKAEVKSTAPVAQKVTAKPETKAKLK